MATVRMANGEAQVRCSECGAPVAQSQAWAGSVCSDCWDGVMEDVLVALEESEGPHCEHCGKPCDPQGEGCKTFCSLTCYAQATADVEMHDDEMGIVELVEDRSAPFGWDHV